MSEIMLELQVNRRRWTCSNSLLRVYQTIRPAFRVLKANSDRPTNMPELDLTKVPQSINSGSTDAVALFKITDS